MDKKTSARRAVPKFRKLYQSNPYAKFLAAVLEFDDAFLDFTYLGGKYASGKIQRQRKTHQEDLGLYFENKSTLLYFESMLW